METEKIKILISSVGSLVGQNILDVLESPLLNRRYQVNLIGTNTINSPNNYRCDVCYKVPVTSTEEFVPRMIDILKAEDPDLVLSARDEDTEKMMILLRDNPHIKSKMPYGKLNTVIYALNKWQTWLFTQKYNLPFAETFVIGRSGGVEQLMQFVDRVGYPLIAKPIEGFASKGVFFVRNWQQAESAAQLSEYMFQEYLGQPNDMDKYFKSIDELTPLFASAPGIFHHSCHTIISPEGNIDRIFISRNEHKDGATIGFRRVQIEKLEEIAMEFAKAIYAEGGYGPLTIQFRMDKNHNWKAQEMNLRTNGNTFPRFIMGQDDLGLILKGLMPEFNFPIYTAPPKASEYIIGKSLLSNIMHPGSMSQFENNGVWKK